MLETLNSRDELGAWLTEHGFEGHAVEIGALNGANARQWISTWGQGSLSLIDPWCAQDPGIYKERQDWTDFEACERECIALAKEFPGRILLVKALSLEAVSEYNNDYLDVVYIDANHAYEAVMADIIAWYPKVKSRGILGGHDLWNDTVYPAWGEVKRAVEDWKQANPSCFKEFYYTPKCGSWWFLK